MSQAENQAKIARKVYPDLNAHDRGKGKCILYAVSGGSEMYLREFDLLEVDDNGNPTQQAKASAFDVFIELNNQLMFQPTVIEGKILISDLLGKMTGDNPCEAIYKAALEVIKAGE